MKFSFALLPAGAFLFLGLLVALFRKIYGVSEDNDEDEVE
jgi:Na+-translocating ferredoxin:NAD+ oxidoreductase RnfE subunit